MLQPLATYWRALRSLSPSELSFGLILWQAQRFVISPRLVARQESNFFAAIFFEELALDRGSAQSRKGGGCPKALVFVGGLLLRGFLC